MAGGEAAEENLGDSRRGSYMPQKKTAGARVFVRANAKTRAAKASAGPARPSKARVSTGPAIHPTHEIIARRAYELWQTAVGRANQPSQHWLKAEAQLRAELKKSATRRRAAGGATHPAHEMVAGRAYDFWQTAVRGANEPSQHWHEAESQLRAELKKSARGGSPATHPSHEMIAKRAYQMWQTAVRLANEPAQHWLEAESQLRAELKKSARRPSPARAGRRAAPSKQATAPASMPKRSARRLAA